jgi:hypothetical protein
VEHVELGDLSEGTGTAGREAQSETWTAQPPIPSIRHQTSTQPKSPVDAVAAHCFCFSVSMAFDHPLEADRVDDLNFFSTIIRAPVVGALFWFLGGEEAKQRNEDEKRLFHAQLFDDGGGVDADGARKHRSGCEYEDDDRSAASSSSSSYDPRKPQSTVHSRHQLQHSQPLRKAPPSMAESDISSAAGSSMQLLDDGVHECGESLDRMSLREGRTPEAATSAPLASSTSSLKRKKELSWSDESGRNLVEYAGGEVRPTLFIWILKRLLGSLACAEGAHASGGGSRRQKTSSQGPEAGFVMVIFLRCRQNTCHFRKANDRGLCHYLLSCWLRHFSSVSSLRHALRARVAKGFIPLTPTSPRRWPMTAFRSPSNSATKDRFRGSRKKVGTNRGAHEPEPTQIVVLDCICSV